MEEPHLGKGTRRGYEPGPAQFDETLVPSHDY